ncbi:MAG: glycosyltransferase, partial [Planctomycetota bacterium]
LKSLTGPFEDRWRAFLTSRRKVVRRAFTLPYQKEDSLLLEGVVYTSIFNPTDGRKNWIDLLTAFQTALADCDDATLIVKLITSRPEEAMKVIRFYLERDIPHRCRVVFLCDYLTGQQMADLAQVSDYYLQATRAEGNCLPLMNFLAAGRPGVSPRHSAIGDYFDDDFGFVVESHQEPAAWPHDRKLRIRSTWGRLVWPSLVEQIRASYETAKREPSQYAAMSNRCRGKMSGWAHESVIWSQLEAALSATHERATAQGSTSTRKAA